MLEAIGALFLVLAALSIPGLGPIIFSFSLCDLYNLNLLEGIGVFGLTLILQAVLYTLLARSVN